MNHRHRNAAPVARRHMHARLPLAVAIHFACFAPVFAADAIPDATPDAQASQPASSEEQKTTQLAGITVTAQKRAEDMQKVPISIDVLPTDKLTEMNVKDASDYVKLLPSLSTSSSQGAYSPGFGQMSMRGVESGSNGNHSGPSPSVGIYLDEEPITTIVGSIDPHIYDVQRIEALAGPQGTLYGASSQAGTIRIITNKPDPSAFSASVSVEGESVDHGGLGYVTEGYVNLPLTDSIALRLVGYSKEDPGYIDNVYGTRTYPTSKITINNADRAKNDYNVADTRGGRAALKIDLNDDWSITPTIMGQRTHVDGLYAFDPHVGDLEVTHFFPENSEDRWIQSALTVQGKIANFDIVYAASHLNRSDHYQQDYSDYSFWYDTLNGSGQYIKDNSGNLIDPSQHINASDVYRKTSNELRISSPKEDRLRFVVGGFTQRQSHDIFQQYVIDHLASSLAVTGWPGTWWLTRQVRTDNDQAIFGEATFDFTDKLTGTIGTRYFQTQNSLRGFFGFGLNNPFGASQGEPACISPVPFEGAPCTEFNKRITETDHIGRANLTYKFDDGNMIYATWSEGFRPGGINRRGTLPPYKADFLTNYEAGWKTEWLDHRLRWNGAVFQENWKDFQFAVVGANGLTEIHNANQARIRGFESNVTWMATYNLAISGGVALYQAVLTQNYCGALDANDNPITDCPVSTQFPNGPLAPKGARLPITPKVKGNLTARYTFDLYGHEAYWQVAGFGTGRRRAELSTKENNLLGDMPGYSTWDVSAGIKKDKWSIDAYVKNLFDSRGIVSNYAECPAAMCGAQTYLIPTLPRTAGVRVTRDFD